ncbi:MAG: nucleotide sugar dehydrogenase [Hyphomicrobiales bacterium]
MPHGRKISVIGLGYVGLPVATTFAATGVDVIAFDIDTGRIAELKAGHDRTGEVEDGDLSAPGLFLTADPADLSRADFHIVTVPTPITANRQPDLRPLLSASRTVGRQIKKGDIVVYESTVYPGATEEDCVPILEAESGLKFGTDFTVGYSPERINPGDKEHRFSTITKVVSGSDAATLDAVAAVYGSVVKAGVHRAPTIKVAEAAKVIENTQRDLNIALMNELAMIFDKLGIRTKDVLEAAGTKWNFLKFTPGLVGGHCIGVDPYYLTAKAETVGYNPEVILAGRRINDNMGPHVAQRLIKLLVHRDHQVRSTKIGILGLTFKENVPDLRNSRVPDIIRELMDYGIEPLIHDPMADAAEARHEYGVTLSPLEAFSGLDAVILAVPHREYLDAGAKAIAAQLKPNGIVIDVKSALSPADLPDAISYWSL